MPRGDQTGPMGQGPMSGRKTGYCAGFEVPGYANAGPGGGRGMGWGRGRGRGLGAGYCWGRRATAPSPDMHGEPPRLKTQPEKLKNQLEAIEKRLEKLEMKD